MNVRRPFRTTRSLNSSVKFWGAEVKVLNGPAGWWTSWPPVSCCRRRTSRRTLFLVVGNVKKIWNTSVCVTVRTSSVSVIHDGILLLFSLGYVSGSRRVEQVSPQRGSNTRSSLLLLCFLVITHGAVLILSERLGAAPTLQLCNRLRCAGLDPMTSRWNIKAA